MSVPLLFFNKGSSVIIESIEVEYTVMNKLNGLGIRVDSIISIFNKQLNGSIVIGNDSFKIAIDHKLASIIRALPV